MGKQSKRQVRASEWVQVVFLLHSFQVHELANFSYFSRPSSFESIKNEIMGQTDDDRLLEALKECQRQMEVRHAEEMKMAQIAAMAEAHAEERARMLKVIENQSATILLLVKKSRISSNMDDDLSIDNLTCNPAQKRKLRSSSKASD